jgi:thiol:disulfide interchange protein
MLHDWKNRSAVILTTTAVMALTACGAGPAEDGVAVASVETISSHGSTDVTWEDSWDSAFSRARNEGKPVLVSFEAEWCVWCKKLETTTYRDAKVQSLITSSLVPLTLDVDGAGRELSDEHGVESLPTVLVFGPDGTERGRINGYLPPGRFVEVMAGILQEG